MGVNDVVYELLEEIDEICKSNGIEYSLEDIIVRDAYNIKNLNYNVKEANVSMDTKNIKKFLQVMKNLKKENRAFETVLNTRKKRELSARYLNTKTSYIHLDKTNKIANKYISVNIHMRLNDYDNPDKLKANKLQIAWRSFQNDINTFLKYFLLCLTMEIFRFVFGELRVGKKVWRKWISYNKYNVNYSEYNNYLKLNKIDPNDTIAIMRDFLNEKRNNAITNANKNKYTIIKKELPMVVVNNAKIPALFYEELTEIEIRGRKFPVPKETDLYLWFRLGLKKAFNANINDSEEDISISENISIDEFREKYAEYFKDDVKLWRFFTKERIIRRKIRLPILKMISEFEKAFFAAEDNN